jgi:uncharacterized protein (DUF927 family)
MKLSGKDFRAAVREVQSIIRRPPAQRGRITTIYDYTDESGKLLFQTVRYEPKGFRQRRPDGYGGWISNLKDVRRVLYRLPELACRASEPIFLCEGEKDVDTIEALGLLATTNPMGAGKWRAEYSQQIRGRSVVCLPDNDPPTDENGKPHYKGQKHMAAVAADLIRVGCETRIIELPEGKDVSDWVAAGGTLEQLQRLFTAKPTLTAEALARWGARWALDIDTEQAAGDRQSKATTGRESSAFQLTDEAVLYNDPDPEKEPLKICGRLEVAALTCSGGGDGWGRLLRWNDPEGRSHQWAMPMSLLSGDGNEYRARLLDGGLYIAPGHKARELLTVYLQTARSETRTLCVSKVGWHENAFVLPGATIAPDAVATVLFQSPHAVEHLLNVAGTLDDWRANVGQLCSGNSRLILAVSCAFAGPILALVGGESGGIHFKGDTSRGKTTALIVGGSVLGGGGRNGFVQSWRATTNGLEAMAELHNDLCLFLDELGQMDPREAADTAYLLGNGSGKARMSHNIVARKKLTWRLIYMSAGEVTLADHTQTAGQRTKGGAEVRLLNVEADAGAGMGLFEDIHGADSEDAFARQLKDAAQRYYGAALRAQLEFIVRNRVPTEKAIKDIQADFIKKHVPDRAPGEVYRAAQRFALVAAAGEHATDIGITGWAKSEAIGAAAQCFDAWLERRGAVGTFDSDAAIRQVKSFIEVNGAGRFQSSKALDCRGDSIYEKVINRAGFRVDQDGAITTYLVLTGVFRREVCYGFDHRTVLKALDARGFLETQPPHLTKKCRLPEVGNIRVYAVKSSILDA